MNPNQECKIEDLPSHLQDLCLQSLTARKFSYSPYSRFKVGAALLVDDEQIVQGCNVENASYGLAICAERTAAVKAVSTGQQNFKAIAISGHLPGEYVVPCGACRQFLCEFDPDLPIYLVMTNHSVKKTSLDKLLPECFSPKKFNFEFHNNNQVQS